MNVRERQALIRCCTELNAMREGGDEEADHSRAEEIVCSLLTEVGFEDAAKAFEAARDRVGFWYA